MNKLKLVSMGILCLGYICLSANEISQKETLGQVLFSDKNYGGFISVWDRVFGSLKLSNEVRVMKFGLRKNQMGDYTSLKSLLFRPFINLLIKRKN